MDTPLGLDKFLGLTETKKPAPDSVQGNDRFLDAAGVSVAGQSVDAGFGDVVFQAGNNRRCNPHAFSNLRFCQVVMLAPFRKQLPELLLAFFFLP